MRNSGHGTQWLPLDGCTKALQGATFSNKFSSLNKPWHKVNEWQYTGFISTNYASGMPAFTHATLFPLAIICLFCCTELAYHTHSYIFSYNQSHSLAVTNTHFKLTTLKFHYVSSIIQNISNKLVCSSFLSNMKCRTVIFACTQYFQVHNIFWIGICPISSYTQSLHTLLAQFLHTGLSYEWTGYINLQQSVLIILK
jgi:hypothetical protein